MTKEKDRSKSAYIAHIGGFFTFVALAGLSLIGWGLNHHCWSKKSCCFKEYHNPVNIRVFWWISFMGLCGVFACCISGFVTSHNFSIKVESTKCIYERIYYDSIFGEINKENKDNKKIDTPWVGLNERQRIIDNFGDFLIKNKNNYYFSFNLDNLDKTQWIQGKDWIGEEEEETEFELGSLLDPDIYYTIDFKNRLTEDIFEKCKSQYSASIMDINGELICDSYLKDPNSYVYGYIKEINRIAKYFFDEVKQIENFINKNEKDGNKKKEIIKSYERQLNIANNTLKNISDDLDNYKNGFLNDAKHYIDIYNICGYILVTIFYSILLAIVVCSCFLLWAYSYFKEQRLIYTFMHVAWNILKFFSFLFFMFGAAFGASYLVSRDLIGYNQFLFSNLNLAENDKTYLLPDGASKEFFRYCLNEDNNSNYIYSFEIPSIVLLKNLYFNMKEGIKINGSYPFEDLKVKKDGYYIINQNLRNIQDEPSDTEPDETILVDFTDVGNEVKKMINKICKALYETSESLRLLQSTNIIDEIKTLGQTIDKLNCNYLKNEIQILFDSLYELSIASRISCALCCCIGFFLELSISFYLLVLYHYNNTEFKDDNDTQKSFPKNRNRKFDLDSQNEFMDKSRPPNMKKNNRKLDLEFNFN